MSDPSTTGSAPRDQHRGDPVLERRARLARYVKIGQRTGYVLLLAGFVIFVIWFMRGFTPLVVTVIEVLMVTASVLLIPTIVLSHGIRAAEREERLTGGTPGGTTGGTPGPDKGGPTA